MFQIVKYCHVTRVLKPVWLHDCLLALVHFCRARRHLAIVLERPIVLVIDPVVESVNKCHIDGMNHRQLRIPKALLTVWGGQSVVTFDGLSARPRASVARVRKGRNLLYASWKLLYFWGASIPPWVKTSLPAMKGVMAGPRKLTAEQSRSTPSLLYWQLIRLFLQLFSSFPRGHLRSSKPLAGWLLLEWLQFWRRFKHLCRSTWTSAWTR